MISKDLIHWQRLPPPIQGGKPAPFGATGERTYDGSISILPKEDGGPVFLYDAPDKIPKGWPGCGECILSIARLKDPDDKYLQLFTRDEQGGDPVNISVSAQLWLGASSLADPNRGSTGAEYDQGCPKCARRLSEHDVSAATHLAAFSRV